MYRPCCSIFGLYWQCFTWHSTTQRRNRSIQKCSRNHTCLLESLSAIETKSAIENHGTYSICATVIHFGWTPGDKGFARSRLVATGQFLNSRILGFWTVRECATM